MPVNRKHKNKLRMAPINTLQQIEKMEARLEAKFDKKLEDIKESLRAIMQKIDDMSRKNQVN